MDTTKMQHTAKPSSDKFHESLEIAREIGQVADKLRRSLESAFLREQIVEIAEGLYDIGQVKEAYEIFGGYINRARQKRLCLFVLHRSFCRQAAK